MKNNISPNSGVKYWLILLLVIIVEIIFAWNAVKNDQKIHIAEIESRAEKQIQYLNVVIREKLQNKEYVSADIFLQQWGKHQSNRIVEITLTTANGFSLSRYQSKLKPLHFFSLSSTIPYSYHSTAALHMTVSLDSIFKHSSEFALTLGSIISLFTLFLTIMIWLYVRRKRLSVNLQDSEKKYRDLANEAPDLRYRTDNEGKIVFVSHSVHKITGYTVEEVIGIKMAEFYVNPEERDLFLEELQKTGYVDDFVVQLKRKNSSAWWGSVNTRLYKDHADNILGVDGVVRDITESKKTYEKLARSESKLESIFRTAPTGIGVTTNRVFLEVNDRFCEMVGYSREELLGGNARIIYPTQKEFEEVGREQSKQLEELGTGTIETRLQHKDGTIINVQLKMTPQDINNLSAGITFTFMDLTEIKSTEKKLRVSEQRFRSMMESMSDPVYICSDNFRVEYMNPAMIKRSGRDATGEFCYQALHNIDQPCSWCKHKESHGKYFESDVVSPLDSHNYHVSHSPIVNENGSTSNMTIFRDVTELKKLEAQLVQSQKMEAIGTLAGGIAHDFNNILTSILGFSEITLRDLPDGSKAKKNITQVIASGRRAADLVKQILTFSRKEAQNLKVIDPHPVVKEALKMMRSSLPAMIRIEEDIDPDCGEVRADPTQLHQVVINLCTNAFQAMENQKGTLTVKLQRTEITAEEIIEEPEKSTGSFIVLSVGDSGYGMDQTTKERIFEPYFTTKESGKGTGLGLAVIHGIIESCNGFIKVESEPGQGTTFQVYIPALGRYMVTPTQKMEDHELPPTGTERILVVDDEETILNLHEEILKQLGYEVTSTTDSREALELIRSHPNKFDLIVTDQSMPDLSGAELARKVLKTSPTIPIIICTGYSSVFSEEEALAIGIKKYLKKPIVTKDFAGAIRQVLDES